MFTYRRIAVISLIIFGIVEYGSMWLAGMKISGPSAPWYVGMGVGAGLFGISSVANRLLRWAGKKGKLIS